MTSSTVMIAPPTGPREHGSRVHGLHDINHMEGGLHLMPSGLMKDLRGHVLQGGTEDFCNRLWRDEQSLTALRSKPAGFTYVKATEIALSASRFLYGDDKQIVVVKVPKGYHPKKTKPVIVISIENQKCHRRGGWHGFPWLVWVPLHRRSRDYGSRHWPSRVFRTFQNTSHVTQTCTERRHPLPGKELTDQPQEPTNDTRLTENGTSPVSSYMERDSACETVDTYPPLITFDEESQQHRMTTNSTKIDADHQTTIRADSRRPISKGYDAETKNGLLEPPTGSVATKSGSGSGLATDDVLPSARRVTFVFMDGNGVMQGQAPMSECITASDLFDSAYEAGILEENTRMLNLQINGGQPFRMKSKKQDTYVNKVLKILENMHIEEPTQIIEVNVRKVY